MLFLFVFLASGSFPYAFADQYDQTFYWKNPRDWIDIGQWDQSEEWVINTSQGTLQIGSIEVYMSITRLLPSDAVVLLGAQYETGALEFSPTSSNPMQAIRADLGVDVGKNTCGSPGFDFHFIVEFSARRATVEPAWIKCITTVFNFDAVSFGTDGSFHIRLFYYLVRSDSSASAVRLDPNKSPRIRVIFSVAQATNSATTTTSTTAITTPTTSSSASTTTGSFSETRLSALNSTIYWVAGGGGLTAGLVAVFLYMSRRKQDKTRIWDTKPCVKCGMQVPLDAGFCDNCHTPQI